MMFLVFSLTEPSHFYYLLTCVNAYGLTVFGIPLLSYFLGLEHDCVFLFKCVPALRS